MGIGGWCGAAVAGGTGGHDWDCSLSAAWRGPWRRETGCQVRELVSCVARPCRVVVVKWGGWVVGQVRLAVVSPAPVTTPRGVEYINRKNLQRKSFSTITVCVQLKA